MVLEAPIQPYLQWLASSLWPFLTTLAVAAVIALLVAFLATAFRLGPLGAVKQILEGLGRALADLARLSPRRIVAIARLAFQESIRRKVLVAFGVFVIALLFAGWFLDPDSNHPAILYLSFVLTSTNYLVLFLAVFLSAFSLPNDIKHRTIYTVVTKPVVAWEIVLGRILGFVMIGTLMLALMCAFSLVFVERGLRHSHSVDAEQLTQRTPEGESSLSGERIGETSLNRGHRHGFTVSADGQTSVVETRDHTHDVVSSPTDGGATGTYELGAARGMLQAKVPILGRLRFQDSSGQPFAGTNVGYESEYRKYIEGGTLAAAIWRFSGIRGEDFGDTLPLEMNIRAFRTYKGDIEQLLTGTIELVKPAPMGPNGLPIARDGGLRSIEMNFTTQEYTAFRPQIPRQIQAIQADGTEVTVDIFRDLVDPATGELEVWIRCVERAQYLGMGPADLYLKAADRSFRLNFVKGYVSIWLQMVVVICFGVAFSTFLNGPIAMIATVAAVVMGFFKKFVVDISTGELPGGGPVESLVRLFTQRNLLEELEPGPGTWIIQKLDDLFMLVVQAISQAMPDCGQFNTSQFVAHGFDVPGDLMAQHATIALAYGLVAAVAGYFCFKNREIAA